MVTIEVKNIGGNTILPVAGTEKAAGYDIVAVGDPVIIGEIGNVKEVNGHLVTFYRSIDYIEYHTQLFIAPQTYVDGTDKVQTMPCHTDLHPRSSVRKYNLVLANSIGLIDNDYRGEILVCYKYIWQPDDFVMETIQVPLSDGGSDFGWEATGRFLGKINLDKIYKAGDKVGQLVTEMTIPTTYKLVDELDKTARGEGGFGSTDAIKVQREFKQPEQSQNDVTLSTIAERYQKVGGVPIKKRYIDEIKDRERTQEAPKKPSGKPIASKTGITERTA